METPGGWEQSPEEGKQPHLPGWPGPRGWWAGCSACAACSSGAGSVGPSAPGAACKDTEGTWGRDGTKAGLSTAPKLWDPAPQKKNTGPYRSCACSRGLSLRMRVWRCTRRRICGGRLSSLLLLRSRYSRSVRLMKSWLGMASMLRGHGDIRGGPGTWNQPPDPTRAGRPGARRGEGWRGQRGRWFFGEPGATPPVVAEV